MAKDCDHGCPYLPCEGCEKQEPRTLRESPEYIRGCADGYKQGLAEAMKYYEKELMLARINRPIQILVPKDSIIHDLTKD